jgi:DNA-binding MarR family transcriptional regulator
LATTPEDLESLDRLVHEPARLVILTTLASCDSADFTFLRRITGLTNGNLSAHLTKLEEGGLVTIEKRFIDRKPNTNIGITAKGRRAVERHWKTLEQIRHGAGELRVARRVEPRRGRVDLLRAEADG